MGDEDFYMVVGHSVEDLQQEKSVVKENKSHVVEHSSDTTYSNRDLETEEIEVHGQAIFQLDMPIASTNQLKEEAVEKIDTSMEEYIKSDERDTSFIQTDTSFHSDKKMEHRMETKYDIENKTHETSHHTATLVHMQVQRDTAKEETIQNGMENNNDEIGKERSDYTMIGNITSQTET